MPVELSDGAEDAERFDGAEADEPLSIGAAAVALEVDEASVETDAVSLGADAAAAGADAAAAGADAAAGALLTGAAAVSEPFAAVGAAVGAVAESSVVRASLATRAANAGTAPVLVRPAPPVAFVSVLALSASLPEASRVATRRAAEARRAEVETTRVVGRRGRVTARPPRPTARVLVQQTVDDAEHPRPCAHVAGRVEADLQMGTGRDADDSVPDVADLLTGLDMLADPHVVAAGVAVVHGHPLERTAGDPKDRSVRAEPADALADDHPVAHRVQRSSAGGGVVDALVDRATP